MAISDKEPSTPNSQQTSYGSFACNLLKILVLEPDPTVLNTICAILKSKYDVYKATNLLDAFDIIKTKKVAIIISDQALPNLNMSGYEFLNSVRKYLPFSVGILMAGNLDYPKAKSSIIDDEIFKLIRKPFNSQQISSVVDNAVEYFLEHSEKFIDITPTIQKKVKIEPSIPVSANIVIVKTEDPALFTSIQENYTETAHFMRAYNNDEVIQILENNVARVLIFAFERKNYVVEYSDARFLSLLKQELPHLIIIGLLYKDTTNYKELIQLMTDKQIFSYLPMPNKIERIIQQISPAVEQAVRCYQGPIFLKWPPPEREIIPEKETGKENLAAIKTKITDSLRSSLQGFKKLWKKDKDQDYD